MMDVMYLNLTHNKKIRSHDKNLDRPNGIAFSHDEKKLYVADTGENVKCLYVFDVIDNKILNQKLYMILNLFFLMDLDVIKMEIFGQVQERQLNVLIQIMN